MPWGCLMFRAPYHSYYFSSCSFCILLWHYCWLQLKFCFWNLNLTFIRLLWTCRELRLLLWLWTKFKRANGWQFLFVNYLDKSCFRCHLLWVTGRLWLQSVPVLYCSPLSVNVVKIISNNISAYHCCNSKSFKLAANWFNWHLALLPFSFLLLSPIIEPNVKVTRTLQMHYVCNFGQSLTIGWN